MKVELGIKYMLWHESASRKGVFLFLVRSLTCEIITLAVQLIFFSDQFSLVTHV